MDRTLELFKLFHYLKEVTTKSYSLKKLQDLVERRLDKDTPVGEGEYEEFVKHFEQVEDKLKRALSDLNDLVK